MEDKPKNNPNGGMTGMMLIEIFRETIKTNGEVITKVVETCDAVKENTKATNSLVHALEKVPDRLDVIDKTLRIVRWALVPIIVTLSLVIFGIVFRNGGG